MPSFDDDNLEPTSTGSSPLPPQDWDGQAPSADDWFHPVLGAPPRPLTQLGLTSNYWRDQNAGSSNPDPAGGYLNEKTRRLWDRFHSEPITAPNAATLPYRTDQPPSPWTRFPLQTGFGAPHSRAHLFGETQSDDGEASSTDLPAVPDAPRYRAPVFPWEDPVKRANSPGKAGVPIAIDDELSKFPQEIIMTVGKAGTAIEAVSDNIGQSSDVQNLNKSVQSWTDFDKDRPSAKQIETFIPSENKVVLATGGAHASDTANIVVHGVAHAYGRASGNADQSEDFKNAWAASQRRLGDKYYAGDPEKLHDPAKAADETARAQRETYAESLARFLSGAPNFTPELDQYWQKWSKAKGW